MAATQVVEDVQPVAAESSELVATLTVLTGSDAGSMHRMGDNVIVGRADDASVRIDDPGLSRCHARIYRRGDLYYVEDLQSTNGTFVGGCRVRETCQLEDGSRVQFGKNAIVRFALQDRLEQEAAERIYEQTVRDPLTGLHNRRHLEEQLGSELAYCKRHGTPLSVLILDADHFKRINDQYGHPAGDAVLRELGVIMGQATRAEDVAARYGGEEFVVLARAIDSQGAAAIAERIRQRVQDARILHQGVQIPVTVSIGVATAVGEAVSVDTLMAAADAALYRAKQRGRNRVEISARP